MSMKQANKNKFEVRGKDSTIGFLFCGAVSGTISRTIAAPFERLKILMQVQDLAIAPPKGALHQVGAASAAGAAAGASGEKYKGVIQSLVRIGRDEGVLGYFRGNFTNIVRAVPYQAAQFVSYEKYKQWFAGENKTLSTRSRLICGSLAGCTSVLVSYPLDVVRCRLSAQNVEFRLYGGIWDCLRKIVRQEGLVGLYRGLWPTLLGIAPYVAFNFTLFERFKASMLEYSRTPGNPHGSLSVYSKLAIAGVSGTLAQTLAYPLDVIRRRMQMQGVQGTSVQYKSVADAFVQIYRKYGIPGFYKGLVANWLKVFPVVSVNFVVYEYMKIWLGLSHGDKEI